MTLSALRRARLIALGAAAAIAAATIALIVLADTGGGRSASPASVVGEDLHRSTIYHSPQHPGYTAWVGAWVMPDGSLMTAFDQATGPVDPRRRALMPAATLRRDFGLTETRRGSTPSTYQDPRYDFWGLAQQVIYLRSTDDGRSWSVWRRDPFRALSPQAYSAQADTALPDGTLIRRVSGVDLANDPSIPHTALLQTLSFDPTDSTGQAAAWSAPRVVLHDPRVCTYQFSRIRQLSDGRVIALGAVVGYAHGHSGPCAPEADGFSYLLMVAPSASAAEQGRWSLGMPFTGQVAPNEWDVAQLRDGNLLALMRTAVDGRPVRRQAILQARGGGWVMQRPRPLPDLPAFTPSGHPDLLATDEGAIVSFSDTGTAYTTDGGTTWHTLRFGSMPHLSYASRYYPYAIQGPDGRIEVFSSDGYDIPYGAFDESIVMDSFRLQVQAER
ncbi:MAG: exo-alpha-sialidase [Solirubrobacterales bacterium]|nr:exo-alpha-sialidase [Solirubrobacterales bacterium]